MAQWVVHLTAWYDAPEEFRPDRWQAICSSDCQSSLISFCGGPRQCIGMPSR